MALGTRAEQAAAGKKLRMSGGMCRLALLHRAGSSEHFQIQLSEIQGIQLASRQQRASGAQKQLAEVPVRPSVVIPDEMAEERVGQMVSQGTAQLLAEELHLRFLSHWNPAVEEGWAAWAGPF